MTELGCWSHIPSSFALEVLLSASWDWCCIDRQHGMADEGDLLSMLQLANARRVPAFVRPVEASPAEIGRVLDLGADGVIVPMVHSAEQAAEIAAACRFQPHGTRSWGPTRRDLRDPAPSAEEQNRDARCFAMIESRAGLEEADAIAAVDGIDGLFVGPADLALDLGSADQVGEAAARVLEACRAHGVVPGAFAGSVEATVQWRERGFTFIAVNADGAMLARAARDTLADVRGATNPP